MIWIQNQLVGAMEGEQMTLECHSEAYPKSINYWTKENGEIIAQGAKYEPVLLDNAYKIHMKLTIKSVTKQDYGTYKCVSKNSLGDTDGSIRLYEIPRPTTVKPTTTTTTTTTPAPTIFREPMVSTYSPKLVINSPNRKNENDIPETIEKTYKKSGYELFGDDTSTSHKYQPPKKSTRNFVPSNYPCNIRVLLLALACWRICLM
ncbi:hypothetical protein WDU94_004069 [Cyamophila willieti]